MLNESQPYATNGYYNRDRPAIVAMIKPGPNAILDLGCGAGAVGRKLREQGKAAELVGIELFDEAAQEAARHYTEVLAGDIEEMSLPYNKRFDYVLCGDILEHLKDPYSVVRKTHDWLKDEGYLICSVPNVRYWIVLRDLVFKGAWDYCDSGIMDRTHLRFFTRRSCFKMLRDASFVVEHCRMPNSARRYLLLNALTFGVFNEFLGSQIVVLAKKRVFIS